MYIKYKLKYETKVILICSFSLSFSYHHEKNKKLVCLADQ